MTISTPRPITVNAQFLTVEDALAAFRAVAAEMFAAGFRAGQEARTPATLHLAAAARHCGVSERHLRREIAAGRLDSTRAGSRVLVEVAAVERVLRGNPRTRRKVGATR